MISFYKYQGTGNDFIMVDDLQGTFPAENIALIEQLCNRRFGIGADGLILLQRNAEGQYYMQYFNSDGKESSMCGNGGRCFARFIYDLGLETGPITFMAIDGLHEAYACELAGEEAIALKMIDVPEVKTLDHGIFELNTGSPHYVKFVETQLADFQLVPMARNIRYAETYAKQGINVNFLNLKGLKEVQLRTYERGVEDETLSCGTGATASAMATAIFNGLPAGTHSLKVKVEGGSLEVKFRFDPKQKAFSDVWLIGPAKSVFVGSVQA